MLNRSTGLTSSTCPKRQSSASRWRAVDGEHQTTLKPRSPEVPELQSDWRVTLAYCACCWYEYISLAGKFQLVRTSYIHVPEKCIPGCQPPTPNPQPPNSIPSSYAPFTLTQTMHCPGQSPWTWPRPKVNLAAAPIGFIVKSDLIPE